MSRVSDTAQETNRHIQAFARQFNALTPERRKVAALRAYNALRRFDDALRDALAPYMGRELIVIVNWRPTRVILDDTFLNRQRTTSSRLGLLLHTSVSEGTPVPVEDADAFTWISTILLAVLAVVALLFAAPVVAVIAALGAAFVVISQSISTTTGEVLNNVSASPFAAFALLAGIGLVFYLYKKGLFKGNAK